MNKNPSLIEKAMRVAVRAHLGQTRKESDLPYIGHPFMVAFKLVKYNFSDVVIAAALVHDVLEDTDFSKEELQKELGDEVTNIIEKITYGKSLSWEEKRKKYVEVVRGSSEGVKAVSVADKIHNLESILIAYQEQGHDLWKKFTHGKEKKLWFENEMIRMLKESWSHPLINEYEMLLTEVKKLD